MQLNFCLNGSKLTLGSLMWGQSWNFYPKELIKCVKTEHMLNAAVASE